MPQLVGWGQTGGTFCRICDTTVPSDTETLAELYHTHDAYVPAVNGATGAVMPLTSIMESGSDCGGERWP